MKLLNRLYVMLHRSLARPSERGEYSGGMWQDRVRAKALSLCEGVSGRLLEIGCGEGLFISRLKAFRPQVDVWGVDNDAGRLARAGERLAEKGMTARLSVEDAARLPFPDGHFDAVVCVNVFFNMDSLDTVRKTLAEMKRVCRSGGLLVFDFRNAANLLLRVKYALAHVYDHSVRDLPLRTYHFSVMSGVLGELGLKIRRRHFIGTGGPFAPLVVLEVEK
ncbi:MAG: class I SAM-dependent methyltransferase [Deltaproteobacteria bacterium]